MKAFILSIVGACLVLMAAGPLAAQPVPKEPAAKKSEPKRFTMTFRDKSWMAVFEWYVEQTGLPFVGSMPAGKFTFVPPAGKTFTETEVFDILNEGLRRAGFQLLRRADTLTWLPLDAKLDASDVPTVRTEELFSRPRTELVRVLLPLRTLKATELMPEVKRLLGPSGEVGTLANRLVIQDMAQNVAHVVKLVREIEPDAPPPGGAANASEIKVFPVRANAEIAARALQTLLRDSRSLRIAAVSGSGIIASGTREDLDKVAVLLQMLERIPEDSRPVIESIPIQSRKAAELAETLKAMFGGQGGLYIEADVNRNALVVRGTREQIADIQRSLVALGEGSESPMLRTITIDRGSATVLAEEIKRMLHEMRPNVQVRIVAPAQGDAAPAVPVKREGKPGEKIAPSLTLVAVGNRLIANSEDQEVLALVQELMRLVSQPSGEGDFTVIRVRFASALQVARTLSEMFNGPADKSRAERIRIIADPMSNSLLIKATPLDLATIKRLLDKHLDAEREGDGEIRTFIIGPLKHAVAAEMVKLLKETFTAESQRAGLTVTSDQRTNTLVLRCSPALFKDAQMLVAQLDEKTADKPK